MKKVNLKIVALVLAIIAGLALIAWASNNSNENSATAVFNGNPVTDQISRHTLSLPTADLKGIANDMCNAIITDTSGDLSTGSLIPCNFRELMHACADNKELLLHITDKAYEAYTAATANVEHYSELYHWVTIPEVRILSEYFAYDFEYDEAMPLPSNPGFLHIVKFYPEAECAELFKQLFLHGHYFYSVQFYIQLAKVEKVGGLNIHDRAVSRLEYMSRSTSTVEIEKCSEDLFSYITHSNHSTLRQGLTAEEQKTIRSNILNNWHFDFSSKYWHFLHCYIPEIVDEAYACLLEDAQLIQKMSNEELKNDLNDDIYSLAHGMWEGDKVFSLLQIIGRI